MGGVADRVSSRRYLRRFHAPRGLQVGRLRVMHGLLGGQLRVIREEIHATTPLQEVVVGPKKKRLKRT